MVVVNRCTTLALCQSLRDKFFVMFQNSGEMKMKKLIALAMMVVCVTAFSMGCGKPEPPKKPASTPTTTGTPAPTPAPAPSPAPEPAK